MYKLKHNINSSILLRKHSVVFGYEIRSGRKTSCKYINKHKKGLVIDNTTPHKVPVYDYNIKTMLEDMNEVFPKTNIYIAGIQDEEQFALFRHFGFIMVKINRTDKTHVTSSRINKWDFLRQDTLDSVHDDLWDVVIDNNDSLNDFYQNIETKIIKKYNIINEL